MNAVGSTAAWSKCEYSYDSRRNLTAVRQYNGNTLASQTSYTYDSAGNMLTMTAGGHTTEYTYDRYGNVLTMEDALGQTESNSYSSLGKLLSKTDRNGITTSYTYDALGRVLAATAGSGNNAETIQYAYTKTGRIATETNKWQETCYTYDELGRTVLVEETELRSAGPGFIITLDAAGGTVNPTTLYLNTGDTYMLPTPVKQGFVFDGWYLGNTRIFNGDTVQVTEACTLTAHWSTNTHTITLNANGGQVSPSTVEVGADGTYTLPTPTKTGYTFNGWYLNSTLIPQDGSVPITGNCTLTAHWTANQYTVVFHRNFSSTDTMTTSEIHIYDIYMLLYNRFVNLSYRLTGWCTSPDGTSGTFYTANTLVRNLTDVPNGTVHLYAIWVPRGRGDAPEPRSGGTTPTYTKSYTYDLAGNRTGFTLTQGNETVQAVTYTYDTLNRLATVSEGNVTQATYTYDVNGNRTSLTYANGVTETYTYNLANWVTGLVNSDGVNTLSSFTYTYYASGNRKTETDLSGKTTSYTYDGLGRLTQESETNGRTIGYSYDAAGNRTQMTVTGTETYTTAYSYDANNRLQSETKTQSAGNIVTYYTYDANGNTLSKTVLAGGTPTEATAFSYNRFNQLVTLTASGSPVYYSYNASGIRTAKLANGVLTSFLLDGGDVVAEVQNDVLYASYLRGVNLICRESNSAAEYYLFDAHADVVALTDETGAVTKSYEYDAFGCEASPDPHDVNPFRYCGEYYDVETGSYYLRARYYVPTIGRFTQQDTHWTTANMIYGDNPQKINEKQDALGLNTYTIIPQITAVMQAGNLYVYGINNPLIYCDYTGNSIILVCVLVCAGIGAAVGGYLGNNLANVKGATGTDKVIYITAGALLGGGIGAAVGYGAGHILTVIAAEASSLLYGTVSGTIGAELLNSWQSAEQSIRNQIGSVLTYAERAMYTPYGTRVVDAYNKGTRLIAEVKYGYMSLNEFIRSEIQKDYYLLSSGTIDKVEWHFFQSAQTGNIGGSSALMEELLKYGFDIVFH